MFEPTTLHFKLDLEEAKQLKYLLNRATNCLAPEKWPPIAKELEQHLDDYLRKHNAL